MASTSFLAARCKLEFTIKVFHLVIACSEKDFSLQGKMQTWCQCTVFGRAVTLQARCPRDLSCSLASEQEGGQRGELPRAAPLLPTEEKIHTQARGLQQPSQEHFPALPSAAKRKFSLLEQLAAHAAGARMRYPSPFSSPSHLHPAAEQNRFSIFQRTGFLVLPGCHFPGTLPGGGFLYKKRALTAGKPAASNRLTSKVPKICLTFQQAELIGSTPALSCLSTFG